jgi:hypothetical protein
MGFLGSLVRARAASLLLVWLCLGLVAGCSSLRFGYAHADILLLAALDRYFDLEPSQEQFARRRIKALLAWHRATQLRDYSALLQEARERIRGRVTADDVLAFEEKLRHRLAALGERAAPDFAELALTLKPYQLAHLQGEWAESDAALREAQADGDPEALAKFRVRRFVKSAEFWLGDLSREQEALVEANFAGHAAGLNRFRDEERERRRREWLAVLEGIRSDRPDPRQATERIRGFIAEITTLPDPAQHAEALALRRSTAQLAAALINAATPDQRADLDQKLEGFAGDFTALAKEGGNGNPGG